MNKPLVSIVIPFYNAGETIAETMDSVFAQHYDNFDVWVINDGSTDQASIAALKQYENNPKVHILHQENLGPSVARNAAIEQTKAEFIVPLDADDLIEPNTIENALKIFSNDDMIGVVYGDIQCFGERTELRIQETFDMRKQLIYNQVAICTVIKKSVFEDTGYFDTELSKPGLEDWEFWIRVGSSKWKLAHSNSIHFQVRVSRSSRTFEVANKNKAEIREYVYRKHANLILREYESLFYELKMERESINQKIGAFLLKPYRKLKSLWH